MSTLVIVESPTKAKKIEGILGKGYRCVASAGHIDDLPPTLIPGAPDFQPEYVLSKRGKEVIARIRKAMAGTSDIILATDPDREGEAIAARLEAALKLRNPKRCAFNEITAEAIKKSIAAPRRIDRPLVAAQEARRVLDRIVGYRVSPLLQSATGFNDLSAGRVQSPALRLIVERDREIRNFQPHAFYVVRLDFITNELPWAATWDSTPYNAEGLPHCTDEAIAQDIAKTPRVRVTDVEEARKQRKAPPPLITSTMQQVGSQQLKISTSAVMKAAQDLFEAGAITYHRTDLAVISEEGRTAIWDWLRQVGMADSIPAKVEKSRSKAGAQEAHEAIRPTDVSVEEVNGLGQDAARLYQIIRVRAICSQMKPAVFDTVTVTLAGTSPEGREATFVARGQVLVDKGWMAMLDEPEAEEGDNEEESSDRPLPKLEARSLHEPVKGHCSKRMTKPPAQFTEATLVKTMESLGIGRPSTYAGIIKTLQDREYVKSNKRLQLTPLAKGELVVNMLVTSFQFLEYDFTRSVETLLDQIAQKKMDYKQLMLQMHVLLHGEINRFKPPGPSMIPESLKGKLQTLPSEQYICPSCKSGLLSRKKGAKGYFWGCSKYSKEQTDESCRHTQSDENGKPGTVTTRGVTAQQG